MKLGFDKEIIDAARVIWCYMIVSSKKLHKADLIFVLGSRDDRVAEYAAALYHQKLAPTILISGGIAHKNDLLATKWQENTEAAHFLKILLACKVPSSCIKLETQATNTRQNVQYSYTILKEATALPKSIIVLQKPYMERRTYVTFMKQWPDAAKLDVQISSPPIAFEDYFSATQPFNDVVSIMVGDLDRIIKYPKLGYQIFQKVPKNVLDAQELLIKRGFNQHLPQQ